MSMHLLGVAASAVLVVTATQGVAATLVIDTFDQYQRVSDLSAAGPGNTTSTLADPVGDLKATRTMTVENTVYAGDQTEATYFVSAGGYLSFSNGSGSAGIATLSYSFAPTDFLSYGSNPYLSFDVASFDHNTWIEVWAKDASDRTVSYTELLETGFDKNLELSSMIGDADFDWTTVSSLTFIVNSTNPHTGTVLDIDGRIASITLETVPLPASGLLLMGGVAGLAALRRRNKKSA